MNRLSTLTTAGAIVLIGGTFARTSKETSAKARCSPYRLLKPAMRITADAGCACGELAMPRETAIHARPLCDLIVVIVVIIARA